MNSASSPVSRNIPLSEEVESRSHKRAKIEIACNVCKARKSKCDGRRPVCGPCSTRRGGRDAHACIYRQTEPGAFLTQDNGRALPTSPVANVTGIDQHKTPGSVHQHTANGSSGPQRGHSAYTLDTPESLATHAQANHPNRLREESPVESDASAQDQDVDAMGCLDSETSPAGLLGASSGAGFMRQIRDAADGGNTNNARSSILHPNHMNTKLPRHRRHRQADQIPYDIHLVLPPRRTADQLFKVYWDYSDVIFPWLDQAEITALYSSLWSADDGFDADERIFHCTLNLMFAIASKLDPMAQPKLRVKSANVYYSRAKQLLMCNLLDISRFEVLQTLLLTAQYLQSTNMPKECFQTIGLAIWIAEDMGLHLPETTNALNDTRERELARRVWHGCIVMDRIASMTFGKPSRISKIVINQAVFPLPEGIQNENDIQSRLSDQPAKLDFFIAFCKLHHILGDVLESSYAVSDNENILEKSVPVYWMATKRLEDLFKIEHSLSCWQDELKLHLKYPSTYVDPSETRYVTRQAVILHARYLYTRLLLYRPFFTHIRRPKENTYNKSTSPELQTADIVITRCQNLCVEAALEIIGLIFKNLPHEQEYRVQDVLPSWWYIISYVYTASIVLIAGKLWPSTSSKDSNAAIKNGLDQGYQILQHYTTHTTSARRCMSALQQIEAKIVSPNLVFENRPVKPLDSQQSANNTEDQSNHSVYGYTDDNFLPFQDEFGNFSWLETALFDWDDDPWTVSSLNVDT